MIIKDKEFYSFEGFVKGAIKLLITAALSTTVYYLKDTATAMNSLNTSVVILNAKIEQVMKNIDISNVSIKEQGSEITELKVRVTRIETKIER